MRGISFFLATLLTLAATGVVAYDSPAIDAPDPLARVIQALSEGRHWYASLLLGDLKPQRRDDPQAVLLSARAAAGRGAWSDVTRRLVSAAWLDSVAHGDARALRARAWLETGQYERALEDYRLFLEYSLDREARTLAEIGRARALTGLGEPRRAARAYDRAARLHRDLEPWLAIRAAEALAGGGDTARVFAWLGRAVDVPLPRRALAEAEARRRVGDASGAVAVLLDAAEGRDAGDRSAELRTRAGRILLEDADTAAARSVLRTTVRASPGQALEAADMLSMLPGLRAEDHWHLARAYERSGARARAVPEYRKYMAGVRLSSARRRSLQLRIGELLFRTGSNRGAIEELRRLLDSHPSRRVAVRAEYLIARATYRRGYRQLGRRRLRQVADDHPATGSAIHALALLGDVYEGAGDLGRAREIYEELARRYPWTRSAGRARFRLGILAFLDGDYAGARRHFDRCRQAYRLTDLRVRATYWAARARMAEGGPRRIDEAQRLFRSAHARDPFGYYGLLAAERADVDPWAGLPPGPEPTPVDATTRARFAVIDVLSEAGLHDEASAVLEVVLADTPRRPEELLGLSAALAKHGFGQHAVRLGWRAHARLRGRWSASVLRAIYPLAYQRIILAESRDHRIDPHLLAAIVRQESAFAADVVSRAGARGLLQVMPRTGRSWASRLGVRDYSDELLFHPEINVHLGAAFFSHLQRRYQELQISLVAYNAGPTRARRWQHRPAYGVGPELFAERIPFSETRRYVRGVQRQVRIYRELYREFGSEATAD